MNATADDWESLDQIQPAVEQGWEPTPRVILAEEIVRLVQVGLLDEMPHRDRGNGMLSVPAIVADPMHYWFRMTAEGRK